MKEKEEEIQKIKSQNTILQEKNLELERKLDVASEDLVKISEVIIKEATDAFVAIYSKKQDAIEKP